jgi:zinc protease
MKPLPGPRFHIANGTIPVFVEPSHVIPLVDVEFVLTEGSVLDPPGREGLTRLSAQLVRRGPRGMTPEQFDEAIEALGATLAASVGASEMRFHGAVIRKNLEPYLALVARMIREPSLLESELERQKRKNQAELIELRDHDRALAGRAFRRHLFGDHPYGRPSSGTLETIASFERQEIVDHCARIFVTGNVLVGVAGDVAADELAPLLERSFGDLPTGVAPRVTLPPTTMREGRRVLLVDKPERSQTQVYVGTLGSKVGEPGYHALLASNTAFGGTFTSRLVQEVRAERGWSYGAGSKISADRERDAWTMWTHPAATQVIDCLALELELLDAWVEKGLEDAELERSKDYLVKSHAFDLETASKRLDPQLETAVYGLSLDWFPSYPERVRAVSSEEASAAVRARISPRDLSISLVATASPELERGLAALPGVRSVERIRFDEL